MQRLEVIDIPELGMRWVTVPKAGSGTIRMAILSGLRAAADRDIPRDEIRRRIRYLTPHGLGAMEPSFSFAFVRDPYARLVSCYRDKIVAEREAGRRISPIFAVYGRRFSLSMDFAAFVRAVAATPDERAEKHFRSQVRFVRPGGRDLVSYVGRLERFEDDWAEVARRTQLPAAARAYNRSTASDEVECFDAELLQLVNRRYRLDFEAFGYPMRTTP